MEHFLVNPESMKKIFEENKDRFQMIPLREYLRLGLKPRGSGQGTLNSHLEEMINVDLSKEPLSDMDNPIALAEVGNPYQTIYAMVQGFNPEDPNSGFERPVLKEGPHMVIGLYALDKEDNLHIFRTLQMRTGRLVVDTPRGFADNQMLNDGEEIYTADRVQVTKNLEKIVKEEAGNMVIKNIDFLGADICNTSCIISKSAFYSVEVDYEKFLLLSKMITTSESQRRSQQFEHEGLIGGILDMTVQEYLEYKRNPHITKDITADKVSDQIILNHTFYCD
jgi:hypothetical protein